MSNELNTTMMMSSNNYSLEQIRSMAPSVFTTDKAPHLTDKYIQTPSKFTVGVTNISLVVLPELEVYSLAI